MHSTSKTLMSAAFLAAMTATQAAAELRYDTGNGAYALVYGQFVPAYLSFDDGVSTTSDIVDNTNSNTRIGFWYRMPTETGQFSINFETSFGLRPSALLNQNNTPDGLDWRRTNIRKVEAIWKDDRFGTVFLGQGSMSSDGASSKDLSGTGLVLYNSIPDTSGAFRFRTSAGDLSTKTIGQAFGSFDGGRRARARYDTPSFSGVSLSVSYGKEVLAKNTNQKVADVALLYSGEAGSVKMVGALAYSRVEFETGPKRHDTIGSFSLLHDTGFNVSVAAGNRKEAGSYVYGKLGYKADWLSIGTTALAIDYYAGEDKTSEDSESDSWGVAVVQSFDKANVEVFLGYREYSLDEAAENYRDASSVMFGARWSF